MSQPIYPDLGKTVRDFFSKGYYFGIFKLNVKTRAPNGLESSATGTYNREKQTTVSEYEAKSFFPKYGLTTIAKWNTSNLVTTKLEVMDKLACGLKLLLEGQYNLDSAAKTGSLGTQYRLNPAIIDLSLAAGDEANMLVNGSMVVGHKDFLAGYQLIYDTNDRTIKGNNIALGYVARGLTVHAAMDNLQTIYSGVHYRINPCLEVGTQVAYEPGEDDSNMKTKVTIGTKYSPNQCTTLKAKIDTDNKFGFGYEIKAVPGAMFTLSGLIDGNSFLGNGGGHQIGLGIEFGGQC